MKDKSTSFTPQTEDKFKKKYKIDVKAPLFSKPGRDIEFETADEIKNIYSGAQIMAIAKKNGKFQGLPETWDDDPTIMLSFYRGLVPCKDYPEGIPTLSGDIYRVVLDGDAYSWELIPGARTALRWEGEGGLIERFWATFLNYIIKEAKEVEIKIPFMPHSEFMLLNSSKPCRIRINGQNYIPCKISYSLCEAGVIDITFSGYTSL